MALGSFFKNGPVFSREAGEGFDNRMSIMMKVLGLFAEPSLDTIAELEACVDLPPEEIFPRPPKAPEVRLLPASVFRRPGHTVHNLAFRSLYEPIIPSYRRRYEAEPELHTVRGQLMSRTHRSAGRRAGPTLIYLHGWAQPGITFERLTLLPALMRSLDMDLVHLDLPFHGKRKPAGSRFHGEMFLSADLARLVEALRQSIADVRAIVEWLLAEGRGPVGLCGISLGGLLTMLGACAEERLWFAAPIIGHLGLAEAVRDSPILGNMREELAEMGLGYEALSDLIRRSGFADLAPRIPPERIFIVGAKYDTYLGSDVLEKQWEKWGKPEIYWYDGGHMMIPAFIFPILKELGAFVRRLPPNGEAPAVGEERA